MSNRNELLRLENLHKAFSRGKRQTTAVKNVSLTINRGEIVGLIGESGSGKSTIARLITRLEDADSGAVFFQGERLDRQRSRDLRQTYRHLKMIFQDPRSSFDPFYTLGASLKEALKAAKIPTADRYITESQDLFVQVGLRADHLAAKPGQVSGGECQRAAIARAIAGKPRLLICDEATSALDVSVQAEIIELLWFLSRREKMALFFISHDLPLISSFCDRVYVMADGEIKEGGDVEKVINSPNSIYTKRLLASCNVFS